MQQLAARLGAEKIHGAAALEPHAVGLAALMLARRIVRATVADRHVYLSLGAETFSFAIQLGCDIERARFHGGRSIIRSAEDEFRTATVGRRATRTL